MDRPIVAITMGDAAGIGPEITAKSLARPDLYQICRPVVIGDARVMRQAVEVAGLDLGVSSIDSLNQGRYQYGSIDVLDLGGIDMDQLKMGEVSAMCGRAAVAYTEAAGRMALRGEIGAIVSAPLNKEAMRQAGFAYEGQTEIFGTLSGSKNYGMVLILDSLRLMLYSTHVSLRKACDLVKKETLLKKIRLCHEGLKWFNLPRRRIGVAALNPHGGEGGLFGEEEVKEMIPAIQEAKQEGIDVVGPIPADTVFVKAKAGELDIVLSMYHDQGNIAMKLLGFGHVVTLLVGIPFIRTSTGHGTAFDIAGKNLADPTNLTKAIGLAAQLATRQGGAAAQPA